MWEAYRRNILATLAAVAPAEQIVAEQGGSVVGAVLLYPARASAAYPAGAARSAPEGSPGCEPWPEVRLLAVAPAGRGRGVGETLMRECIRRAAASGAAALTLHTTDMMEAARRLYRRLGFLPAPELDFHPAPGLTVQGYRLDLGRPGR